MQKAIDGETYEFTEMYPDFHTIAVREGELQAAKEAQDQIAESKEHAAQFSAILTKAEKRFAALKKVEERHATAYQKMLQEVQ